MTNNNVFHNNNKTLRDVVILTGIIMLAGFLGAKFQKQINENTDLRVRLAHAETIEEKVVYVAPETVEDYIKYVFEEDADKAFLLLKGRGDGTCAENRYLDPNALNDNTEWGGRGKDWGVFQINDSWQKVQSKFLLNYKVNIEIAHQLFEENGKSFKLWTCGKVYGI